MVNTVLFDLDGTLLPMDLEEFIQHYFHAIKKAFASSKWDSEILLAGIWEGTNAMLANDGKFTNETIFWNAFTKKSGIKKEEIAVAFETFYDHEFKSVEKVTSKNENMIKAVKILKQKGYRLVVATNPLFPQVAVKERLSWAGLNVNDFDLLTSFETFHYCKPNPKYFEEVLEKLHLHKEECMMVGNDSLEDGVMETLGVPVYLIEDHLIHRDDTALTSYWHGSSDAFLIYVNAMKDLTKER